MNMEIPYETIQLIKEKFCTLVNLSQELVSAASHTEPPTDNIIVNLFVTEYRQRLDKEISFPLNWKEAVKERFAPRWFIRRWPVVYKTYSVNALYPNFVPPLPQLGKAELSFFVEKEAQW